LRDGIGETVLVPALPQAPKPGEALVSAQEPGTNSAGTFGTQRIVALAAGGVGLAGIAVGTVFGLKSKSLYDESQAPGVCTKSACDTTHGVELIDRARYAGDVSTVAFVVGGAGLVAGATLWFTTPRSGPQLALGIGTVQIRGSW
jgi:hypothetical protein